VKVLDAARGIVGGAGAGRDRIDKRVAPVGGAENRASETQNARDVTWGQRAGALGEDQSVKAVLEADALDIGVGGRLDDRPNHGVEPGGVAAAREDTYTAY